MADPASTRAPEKNKEVHSQAFNEYLPLVESVNSSTGTLTLLQPLVKLAGINKSIDLELNLVYSANSRSILNFPPGWALDISYILQGTTLFSRGRSYIIDHDWADQHGYRSGLKYINDRGIKFESVDLGSLRYRMTYADGSADSFDNVGKLLKRTDRFGNSNSYSYLYPDRDIIDNYLADVTDSFGQKIKFSYEAGRGIDIVLPNNSSTVVTYTSQGVVSVADPENNRTQFIYSDFAGETVVSQILYPTGLQSLIEYVGIPYATAQGPGVFPAVKLLTHRDPDANVSEQTLYNYGVAGGYTFTGYAGGYLLSSGADGLVDSNNNAYIYIVSIQKNDASGQVLSSKLIYRNYLHLPIIEDDLLVKDHSSSNGHRVSYVYDISADAHARSTNYDKPVEVTSSAWSDPAKDYVPLNRTRQTYDLFGQVLKSEKATYDVSKKSFVARLQVANVYKVASWGGEMPSQSDSTDVLSGCVKQTVYALTADEKNVASESIGYKAAEDPGVGAWKIKTYTYDQAGRMVSKKLEWAKGARADDGLLSTSETYAYVYDESSHQYQITTTNFLKHPTVAVYDRSLPNSPLVRSISALNHITSYKFDLLGRMVERTDPKGNLKRFEYYLHAANGSNRIAEFDPTGYTKVTYFDALHRSIKVLDNGDPTAQASAGVSRLLNQTAYDCLGKKSQEIDRFGVIKTYEYDSYGRCVKYVDELGNINEWMYDGSQSRASQTVNGVVRVELEQDGFGRECARTIRSRDASDATKVKRFEYDAFDRRTKVTIAANAPSKSSESTPLQELTLIYNPDDKATTKKLVAGTESVVQFEERFDYDLNNNVTQSRSVTKYPDGRSYERSGERHEFDALGSLLSITNKAGQVESYTYDADRRQVTRRRYDNTEFHCEYDKDDKLERMSWTDNQTLRSLSYTFNPVNLLTSVCDENGNTISYTYNLDGSLSSIAYPGNIVQAYGRDQYSRLSEHRDCSGTVTTYTYYDNGPGKGLPGSVRQGTNSVDYKYSTTVDSVRAAGLLLEERVSGNKSMDRTYEYDGFTLLCTTIIGNGPDTWLNEKSEYDGLGRLAGLTKSSTVSGDRSVNYVRRFNYDGKDQLVAAETTYRDGGTEAIKYTYDGNNNVLSQEVGGSIDHYAYNDLDQLLGAGVSYDTNGRMLTDGGGNHYRYNQLDQLITAEPNGGGSIDYGYHPDGLLWSRGEVGTVFEFYYDDKVVNAVSARQSGSKDRTWTQFLMSRKSRLVACEGNRDFLYYLESRGSTSLVVAGASTVALDYEPFGALKAGGQIPAALNAGKFFTWNQEYADPRTGLVYLRSRFYNPKLMSFMSMDSYAVSNRYAFANGDPINNVDPTGHASASVIGGAVATILIGLAQVLLVILAAFFPPAEAGVAGEIAATSAATSATLSAAQIAGKVLLVFGGIMTALSGGFTIGVAVNKKREDDFNIVIAVFNWVAVVATLAGSVFEGFATFRTIGSVLKKLVTAEGGETGSVATSDASQTASELTVKNNPLFQPSGKGVDNPLFRETL
jgi:RHS repeat-associated protein